MPFSSFLPSAAGTGLRYALSLAALVWLTRQVDWAGLRGLGQADWLLAAAAVLATGLAYPLQAWRWQLLLRAQQLTPPTGWVHRVFWIGQFYNSFLPGGIAGDAVRFVYLRRFAPDQQAAGAASLIADRLLGLAALCALAALTLALYLTRSSGSPQLYDLCLASAAALGLLLAGGWSAARTRWWEPLSARLIGVDRASQLHDAALALGRRQLVLTSATLLSVAVWLVDFVALWLLARSLGLRFGLLEISVAAAAAYVAAALPISIGGHGVREGTLVATLSLFGAAAAAQPETVALLALCLWAVTVGWSLVGGCVYLAATLTGRLSAK